MWDSSRPALSGGVAALCLSADRWCVMVTRVEDDRRDRSDDSFDRRWSQVLDAEADLLRGYAERLLASGSISIERPAGVVTARFRGPVWRHRGLLTWRRRPELSIDAVQADSSRHAGAHGPMVSKYRDYANLIDEIMLDLAVHLVWLEEDE